MGLLDGISDFASKASNNVGESLSRIPSKPLLGEYSINDLTAGRLSVAGLFPNASGTKNTKTTPKWLEDGNSQSTKHNDWRIRVSTDADILYNDKTLVDAMANPSIMSPLILTNGVNFPITPSISVTHTAKYSPSSLTHSNYAMQFYEGSEVGPISINGVFPIQSIQEGRYLLAAIHFFRSATKMFYGTGERTGTPPPLLFLDGYGDHYFPHVPCVLTSFMHTMPDNVDYIEIPLVDNTGKVTSSTRLPLESQIQIQLQPVYSRASLTKFSIDDFNKGKLLGGFI